MDPTLEEIFATLQAKYAAHYGVKNVATAFPLNAGNLPTNATAAGSGFVPSKEIMLLRDVAAHSRFLSRVNMQTRRQKQGGSFKIGPQGRNTRTNDTKGGDERRTGDVKDPVLNLYQMVKAHFDWGMHDDDLSDMSEFPNWHSLYRAAMLESYANDIQICGFHGVEHTTTSDLSTNELLEDVNKGWIQLLRERNSGNVFTGDANGEVKIGNGGNYQNLDQFIHDLYQGIPAHKRSPGMQSVVGEGLMAQAKYQYYGDVAKTPSEKPQIEQNAVTGVYGGLQTLQADYFFQNGIMITNLSGGGTGKSNLSMLQQKGTMKRSIEYVPKKERTIDWNACWRAYHIEDLDKMVFADVEKVIFLDIKDQAGNPVEVEKLPDGNFSDL